MAVLKPSARKEDSIEIVFGESSSASFSAFVENRTNPQNHDKDKAMSSGVSKEFASAPRDDIFASFPVLDDDSDHSDKDDDIDVFAAIRGGSGGSSAWNDNDNNNDNKKEDGLLVPFPRHEHDADNSNNKEEDDQSTNSSDSSSTRTTNPLQMVRKGAVAVAGGAMVGVGLVMIPLPTPFGAVVAGGGMAVLGTEFEGVQKANERVIDTLIEGIESLDDNDETTKDNTSCLPQQQDDDENDNDESSKRRRRPAALESSKKAASSFLSRNVLPFLRRTRGEYHQPVQEEEEAEISEHYKDNVGESALSGDKNNNNDNDAEQEPRIGTDRPLSSVRP